jgi:hypothetical protein
MLGMVVLDLASCFSYVDMFFELSGATSNRKRGMPRLSRRPSHCGYYVRLSDTMTAHGCRVLYQLARLLVLLELDGGEDLVQLVLFAPVFRGFELLEGFLGYKTTRAQEAPVSSQRPAHVTKSFGFCAYSMVSSSWLACCPPAGGV